MSLGFDANNRVASGYGVTYDAAGNVSNDGTHTYTYNAENQVIWVDSGSTAQYFYDAAGQRVRKIAGGSTVDYIYDTSGNQIAEFSSTGSWNRGEVYAGGHHLATYNYSTTYFIHSDWLGTERARSSASGGPFETCSSLPFGDWLSCAGTDVSPMHFTGKERDPESNLDMFGARYYGSSLGRFMTPDWAAKPVSVPYAEFGDPQSLNLYAYVRNNPLSRVDLDGHNDYLWQRTKNFFSGNGWKTDAQMKGWSVAETARNHLNPPLPSKPILRRMLCQAFSSIGISSRRCFFCSIRRRI